MVDLKWIYKEELKEIKKDLKNLETIYKLGEITEGQYLEVKHILETELEKVEQSLGYIWLRIINIYHDSVVDGVGYRTTIFFAGCPHQCKGCHNPESWNIKNGKEMQLQEVLDECLNNPLTDITFSGGDPFLQAKEIIPLAKALKKAGKNIWAYSGWTYEQLVQNKYKAELLKYIDVLVDGKFVLEQRDTNLLFRGSANQRILQLKDGKIIGRLD